MTIETWLPLMLGYLIPIGFFLLAWGGLEPRKARQVAALGLISLALATLGYFTVGFAFHLGGAAVVSDLPGLAGLDRLVGHRVEAGLYWGVIGLTGFFLTGGADTPEALALFATYLPMVTTAVLLPVMSLGSRPGGRSALLVGLFLAGLVFPLAACWTWGGGWLASLGQTIFRGHGLVDFGGSGVVYLLGGATALGGLVALGRGPKRDQPAEVPPAHFPLLASLGAFMLIVGWLGWSLGTPFHSFGAQITKARVAVNGLLAIAGSTLTCLVYCWLALGSADPLMLARSAAGGLVAIAASGPFLPPLWAAVVGAVSGLLIVLGIYLMDYVLRLEDGGAAVATAAICGVWGLLAPALYADGRWGRGWNGVGFEEYRAVAGQGVTGFLAAPGFMGDGPGQIIAQVAGIVVIGLLGFLTGWLLTKITNTLSRDRRPVEEIDPLS
jgi:Amt family ammonium transporter